MEYRLSDDETPMKKIDLMNLSPPTNDLASKLLNYKRVNEKVKKSLKSTKPGSHTSKPPIFLDRFAEDRAYDEPIKKEKAAMRQSMLVQSHAFALNDSNITERVEGKSRVELLQSDLRASNASSNKRRGEEGTWRIESRLHSRKN